MINKSHKPLSTGGATANTRPRSASTGMAYIPRKNISSGSSGTGDKPVRSAARPGKRSERPAYGVARPPFSKAGAPVKKARWVPRTGSAPTRTSAVRPFAGNGVFPASPFPQKPPYRPNGAARAAGTTRPSSARGTYTKKVFGAPASTSRPSYPPRPVKPFGKPFENRPIKPFGNTQPLCWLC